jgi:hypothetical protein
MPPASVASPHPIQKWHQGRRGRFSKIVILTVIVGAAASCAIAAGLSRWWPFAQTRVMQDLREASDSQVQIRAFHQTYFPAPGCILEGVVFQRGPAAVKPLITIEKLTIRGTYPGLLALRVSRITAEGLRILIPPFGTAEPFHTTPSKITIDEIVANGSAIEFAAQDSGKRSLRFDVHQAFLRDVGWKAPLTYQVKVHNPEPPGEVTAEGKFGVWNMNDPGETPISGEYKFDQADLAIYEGIAGRLASTGKFGGRLAHIDISGVTDTPDFEVKSGGHPVRLRTEFSAYVDAIHGDTFLKRVSADFLKTRVVAQGSVAGSSDGKGKTALIDLSASNARIEDLLRLFVRADRAPMSGGVTLQTRVEIPPGDQEFLKKVKLQGGFGLAGGTFSDFSTQQGVDKLSAGARGEKDQGDPETVLTGLKGQVNLLAGTARLSDLSFGVPGAAARLHGTYNLISYKIDLHGQMRVDSQISNTTSGSKAVLLKMMNPFFKKKRKGEVVPVRISGTYEHPTFGLDLDDKHAKNRPSQ